MQMKGETAQPGYEGFKENKQKPSQTAQQLFVYFHAFPACLFDSKNKCVMLHRQNWSKNTNSPLTVIN